MPPARPLPRRHLLLGVCAGLALAACGHAVAPAAARNPGLRLIGEATLAHRLRFGGSTVGGLSGLDYDPAQDLWVAISDDPSDARFYTLHLPLTAERLGPPELLEAVRLDAPARPDAEAIRWRPATGSVLWSTEGDVRRGVGPSLHESTREGRLLRSFALPPHFAPAPQGQRGPRHNLGFEGLALTPDGRQAWLAMENALVQDGPEPTLQQPGGPCRFTLFDLASGRALAQRAYVPEAIPQAPKAPGLFADNGVSEILMLDAQRMLVLERAYAMGVGNTLRLYRVDLASGDDTLALDSLVPGRFRPLAKTLVADLSAYLGPGLSRLDNTESLAWGPLLPATAERPAQRTLVLLSDDNFNPGQVTQFVAFALTEPL
ncbi:esterase-like activity of phytase family protein [Pseudorhodoferax sp. Leaf265]|uniref:esterase-like activity of phytase family protein n=1 Tax=Pseudorhodoferax sp. Leaf265 TaxID=1736315 RepID=UPI0009EA4349|nr:esterase-like activity of phytase family protein [Pseudorhodoferax sp. Leaf265]